MPVVSHLWVTRGRVQCPNRGTTKLNICLFCEHLTGLDLDNLDPSITCVPPVKPTQGSKNPRPHRPTPPRPCATPVLTMTDTQQHLASISFEHPEWGVARLTRALNDRGQIISPRQVTQFLGHSGLSLRYNRLCKLEEMVVTGEVHPTEHQQKLLEKFDTYFHEWARYGKWPGQKLIHTCLPVYRGQDGLSVNAQIVIDRYSSRTFALLHVGHPAVNAVLLLNGYVLPYFSQRGLRVEEISTPIVPLYQDSQTPSYRSFVNDLGIEQVLLSEESHYILRFQREFWHAWVTPVRERARIQLDQLQTELKSSLERFNRRHPIPGFPNLGRSSQCRITTYLQNNGIITTP